MIGIGKKLRGEPGVDRPMRVLHCPTDVGGHPQCMARMERELGVHSISVVFRPSKYQYESDRVLFQDGDSFLQRQIKTWSTVCLAAAEFDIIHYNFGQSLIFGRQRSMEFGSTKQTFRALADLGYFGLLELSDVAILKRLGKGIVVTYQGDDARQGDYCLRHYEITFASEVKSDYFSVESDSRKRRQIRKFARYTDRTYSLSPNLLALLPNAEYLPCAHVDLRRLTPVYPESVVKPRVLHAPSHRGVKGTRFIIDAVERLRRDGVRFDFELIEDLPFPIAQRRYKEADIVIDQLLAGWYGGLAVEAMALGKPVIAYLRESDLQVLSPGMREDLPIIDATPETIYDVLKEWLTVRRSELTERGRTGREYVERWHDSRAIARRLVDDYAAILCNRSFCNRWIW